MVLSSQAQRRGSGGGGYISTYRQRRRRRARRIAAVVGLVLAAWLAYAMWPDGDDSPAGPADANAATASGDDADAPAPAPTHVTPTAAVDRPQPPTPRPTRPAPTPPKPVDPKPETTVANAGSTRPDRVSSEVETPPKPANPGPIAPQRPVATTDEVRKLMEAGRRMIANKQLLEGRETLNRALAGKIGPADANEVRKQLAEVNATLVFSPQIVPGDPHTESYVIQSGDNLAKIAGRYNVPWRFIARINDDLDPRRIQVGQRVKLVRGPLHCVVDKSDYRMDVYFGDPTQPGAMYVRSFSVGLGAHDGTPLGRYRVKPHSKLINPEWVNPRTGEKYHADNPENPLGEYWLGIEGIEPATQGLRGYGIHGTIEPETIGTQASMGCVRLRDADIELVYYMLEEGQSTVTIVP